MCAAASTPENFVADGLPLAAPAKLAGVRVCGNSPWASLKSGASLKAPAGVNASGVPRRGVSRASAPTAGTYVMTCKSLLANSYGDGGTSTVITPVEGTDSIVINNFYTPGVRVKAAVDPVTGVISIPNQVVAQMEGNGNVDIAFCNTNGTPNRTKKIEGYITDDGRLTLTSWWGLYVVAGANKDKYAYVGCDTWFERANATMSFSFQSGQKAEFGVVLRQKFNNRLEVVNFGNYGMTVNINLNADRTGAITSQTVRKYPENADFISCAVGAYTDTGLSGLQSTIVLSAAPDSRTLQWGKWTAISKGGQNLFFGAIVDGRIVADNDILYPASPQGEWRGEGTAANPYIISSLNDLQLLAERVNSIAEADYNAESGGMKYALAFAGKHFRLDADLDMGGTLFTPVGRDMYHRFGGVFDGNGHTITSFTEDVGSAGTAGLFGYAAPGSELRNITFVKPYIRSTGMMAATLAAYSEGLVENCHVRNADVANTSRVAAALVGLGTVVRNCTVENSLVDGKGGNAAGLAGQINSLIENCSVTGTTVYAATPIPGWPAGGVVASMNGATGRSLYFAGRVDALRDFTAPVVGGVAGILSNGTLERSFAVGQVLGGSEDINAPTVQPMAGGLVGEVAGATIENCYSVGAVSTYLSRQTGGLTGYVRKYDNGKGVVKNPVIRNCYTVATVKSETYQYDHANEVRESLGWVAADAGLTAENVYFDRQVMNLNSRQYGASTAELTAASGPAGFDPAVWSFTANQYPRLKGIDNNDAAALAASAVVMPARNSFKKLSADAALYPAGNTVYRLLVNGVATDAGRFCSISDGKLRITEQFGTDTLQVSNGNMALTFEVKVAPVPFVGEGTETTPYLISSKEDLIALSDITTRVKQYFPGTYFRMTDDIDLAYDPRFVGIASDYDATCKFAGVFDGDGHTVSRMLLNHVVWKEEPAEGKVGVPDDNASMYNGMKGFIGKLAPEAVLRNLSIAADSRLMFWARSGAFVGVNEGLVENCRNYADVTCISTTPGGIVGENRKGTIANCYNEGNITSGYNTAGGITASNAGVVRGCANAGDVTVRSISSFQTPDKTTFATAGGIAGESTGSIYEDCINYGSVSTVNHTAGGITGTLPAVSSATAVGRNSLRNVINVGTVATADATRLGALAGTCATKGEVVNALWDGQIIPLKAGNNAALAGSDAMLTAELTAGTPVSGFDAELWDFTPGMYPALKRFAAEPRVDKARRILVNMAASDKATRFRNNATLSQADGLVWKLAKGNAVKIDGSLLVAPGNVTATLVDTLVAEYGNVRKVIALQTPPAVPLAGEGTKQNPYLIASPDDWNALADFAVVNNESFEGQHLLLASDIDFTDRTFKPLFANGVTALAGTLDGGNHTVKGIAYTTTATYNAPIGTVDAGARLCNLTLEGKVTSAFINTGAFTAKVAGELENLTNRVNLTSSKGSTSAFGAVQAGASLSKVVNEGTIASAGSILAGIAHSVGEGATFTDVENRGVLETTVTTTITYVGGIAASSVPATYTRCVNNGSFKFANPKLVNSVAGIVAFANAASSRVATMTITDCVNNSDFTANNYLAGIVANVTASATITNPLLISRCVNNGVIASCATINMTGAATAGIVSTYTPGSVITGCVNNGDIVSEKNTYTAGIAGYYKGTFKADLPALIEDCSNAGNIVANGNQGAGIVASLTSYTSVNRCSNTGAIGGGWGLGGIVGSLLGTNAYIEKCWNSGDVTTTVNRSGGIIGYNQSEAMVSDCLNLGNVSTELTEGGTSTSTSGFAIGGIAGYGKATFRRCVNAGTVTGASQVGGILGYTYPKLTKLVECVNIGRIVAPADTCGSLIGANLNNSKMWTAENVAEGCLYLTPQGEQSNNTIGTELSEKALAAATMGEGWTETDPYTFPMLAGVAPDMYKVLAARVIIADNDEPSAVCHNFKVGAPQGVVWSVSPAAVNISGNDAEIVDSKFGGKIILTATAGEHSRSCELILTPTVGVDDVADDVVSTLYFTLDGKQVVTPVPGTTCIVVRLHANGTRTAHKAVISDNR